MGAPWVACWKLLAGWACWKIKRIGQNCRIRTWRIIKNSEKLHSILVTKKEINFYLSDAFEKLIEQQKFKCVRGNHSDWKVLNKRWREDPVILKTSKKVSGILMFKFWKTDTIFLRMERAKCLSILCETQRKKFPEDERHGGRNMERLWSKPQN